MRDPTRSCLAALALACALPAHSGETLASLEAATACGFFQGQAYGKGLAHFATEMLWACETIAIRRASGVQLGDRLAATEAALARYREAVIAGAAVRPHGHAFGLSENEKAVLAESTGALAALEGISVGF